MKKNMGKSMKNSMKNSMKISLEVWLERNVKRMLLALTASALLYGMCCVSVYAQSGLTGEVKNENGVTLAPYVNSQLATPDFWIAKNPNAYELLLTSEQIQDINQKILREEDTNMFDLSSLKSEFDGTKIANSLASFSSPKNLYINGQPVPEEFYEAIRNNIRNAAVTSQMSLKYGFAVNRTLLKEFPYDVSLSDSLDDPEWDNQAASAILVNEPLVLYFWTADGKYAYVKTKICSGFVKAEDIAVCQNKEEWLNAKKMKQFLVVTGEKVYLEASATYPESSEKLVTMGSVFELVTDAPALVENRATWNNYVVKMPYRRADGSFSQRLALIPTNRDVSVGFLPFTSEQIIRQAFKSLGNRYGWGGMLDSQDCSSYVREVYRCFGFELPRNTTWQAAMPVAVTDLSEISEEQKWAFIQTLTPGAIIQIPGHEVIYLGEQDGRLYVINDISSIADPEDKAESDLKVIRIRSVIINDMLSTRRRNGKSWLETTTKTIEVWK